MNIGDDAWVSEAPTKIASNSRSSSGESVWRNSNAIGEISVGPPIKLGERKAGASCFENSDGMRDDFTPDPITRENGNALFGVHER